MEEGARCLVCTRNVGDDIPPPLCAQPLGDHLDECGCEPSPAVLRSNRQPLEVTRVLEDLVAGRCKREADNCTVAVADEAEVRAPFEVVGDLSHRPVVVRLVLEVVALRPEAVDVRQVVERHRSHDRTHSSTVSRSRRTSLPSCSASRSIRSVRGELVDRISSPCGSAGKSVPASAYGSAPPTAPATASADADVPNGSLRFSTAMESAGASSSVNRSNTRSTCSR